MGSESLGLWQGIYSVIISQENCPNSCKGKRELQGAIRFFKAQQQGTEAHQNESFLLFAGKFLYMHHLYPHVYFIVLTEMNRIRVYLHFVHGNINIFSISGKSPHQKEKMFLLKHLSQLFSKANNI